MFLANLAVRFVERVRSLLRPSPKAGTKQAATKVVHFKAPEQPLPSSFRAGGAAEGLTRDQVLPERSVAPAGPVAQLLAELNAPASLMERVRSLTEGAAKQPTTSPASFAPLGPAGRAVAEKGSYTPIFAPERELSEA